MKKHLTTLKTLAALCLAVCLCLPFASCAKKTGPSVFVTIVDSEGNFAMAQVAVDYTDADKDGKITFNDAMISAHDKSFKGGADAGYKTAEGQYGLYVSKLWGGGDGGSYGYYINNASAMSPLDEVKENDHIVAFFYRDLENFTDTYAFFDKNDATAKKGENVTLVLKKAGYDADWNPVTVPCADAVITVDGEKTEFKTSADGSVTLTLGKGKHTVSAVADSGIIVGAICTVTVK
ncbi:MAG: hypothetical protein MJ137_03880 [Clostridia bacterium]|nr:hypothetical protein [Clostridia bacterium]